MSKKFYRDIGLFLLTVACLLATTSAGFSSPAIFLAQQTKISGKVTSADGEVLPGVNVIIKGTNEGTVTDADGVYSINVPGPDATLVFSFIGFSPEEITVGNQTAHGFPTYDKLGDMIGFETRGKTPASSDTEDTGSVAFEKVDLNGKNVDEIRFSKVSGSFVDVVVRPVRGY